MTREELIKKINESRKDNVDYISAVLKSIDIKNAKEIIYTQWKLDAALTQLLNELIFE